MKLNTRRTLLVGMAFLSICAFWQVYDNIVPLILQYSFGVKETVTGTIMALDNVLAIVLLPFFGTLSDRTATRYGKRTPYIVGGTLAAIVLMNLLPFSANTHNLTLFVVALCLLLIAMGTYRSPAVALMPDVTPKPLRSKGNAIINLMGALGGAFTLLLTKFLVKGKAMDTPDYTWLFAVVAALMLVAVIVLVLTIREKKLAEETTAINDAYDREQAEKLPPEERVAEEAVAGKKGFAALSPDVRKSLILILASVSLWFMGYNAVTTAFSRYAAQVWGMDVGQASMFLMIATIGAIVSYIPVGVFSARFGRKRVIQFGVAVLALCFLGSAFFTSFTPLIYVVFVLIGLAWAAINVNSYPMVVEISKSADVGKFTGYYYTFSMAAQIVTPIVSGYLLEHVGYWTLLPYAAVMVALSFVTISLTKHGDSKPEPPKSKLEAFDTPDD